MKRKKNLIFFSRRQSHKSSLKLFAVKSGLCFKFSLSAFNFCFVSVTNLIYLPAFFLRQTLRFFYLLKQKQFLKTATTELSTLENSLVCCAVLYTKSVHILSTIGRTIIYQGYTNKIVFQLYCFFQFFLLATKYKLLLFTYSPRTPGSRCRIRLKFANLKNKNFFYFFYFKKQKSGRSFSGIISTRHKKSAITKKSLGLFSYSGLSYAVGLVVSLFFFKVRSVYAALLQFYNNVYS